MKLRNRFTSLISLSAIVAIISLLCVTQSGCGGNTDGSQKLDPAVYQHTTSSNGLTRVRESRGEPSNLLIYKGFDVSFNADKHIPNYVAWELTGEETTGGYPRPNKFHADPKVKGCAQDYDYSYSGYDRGHMAPAADMKWDKLAMAESFTFTNICPQVNALNAGAWKTLEEKCRTWALIDGRVIIICGPVIDGNPVEYIGESKVYVPRQFFKVILSPDAQPMRAIAFLMPNAHVPGGMQKAVTTVDHIEELTGMDFFASLPDEIENKIEAESNFNAWPRTRRK